jgi:predicted AAA+ superfamily ATPase
VRDIKPLQQDNSACNKKSVHNLVSDMGIEYDVAKLDAEAEKFALARGQRSARAAKHFADSLASADEEKLKLLK